MSSEQSPIAANDQKKQQEEIKKIGETEAGEKRKREQGKSYPSILLENSDGYYGVSSFRFHSRDRPIDSGDELNLQEIAAEDSEESDSAKSNTSHDYQVKLCQGKIVKNPEEYLTRRLAKNANSKKIKKDKKPLIEFAVVYKKSGSNSLGARKISCGLVGEKYANNSDPLLVKKMQDLYKSIVIDHPEFNQQIFEETGAYFNPKFWEVNLLWKDFQGGLIVKNFNTVDRVLKN